MRPTAYFVCTPRRLSDLRRPHRLGDERPYHITAEIVLPKIDFENFTEDMLADRDFPERHAPACGTGDLFRCLLVRQRGGGEAVLVVPKGAHVYYAAAAPFGERSEP